MLIGGFFSSLLGAGVFWEKLGRGKNVTRSILQRAWSWIPEQGRNDGGRQIDNDGDDHVRNDEGFVIPDAAFQ